MDCKRDLKLLTIVLLKDTLTPIKSSSDDLNTLFTRYEKPLSEKPDITSNASTAPPLEI